MPSLDVYKRQISYMGATVGTRIKRGSDIIMESTWDNDPQSKVCYLYDYLHDDDPDKEYDFNYTNTMKHRIDCKFIITQYSTLAKDQVEYHIMFRPTQKLEFQEYDDLYWFEENYHQGYGVQFPIGQYIDIPDEKGIYKRWLICGKQVGNSFEKYSVLPCDYRFQWIDVNNGKKEKRQMWGCSRAQNSYTSGVWIDRYFYSLDDVNGCWLPLNPVTEHFGYLNALGQTQRIVYSAKTDTPLTYKVTKVNNTKPIGIVKVTIKQDNFNQHTDYVEKDANGNIIGMWADYYLDSISPKDDHEFVLDDIPVCTLSTANLKLRVGGSYKTISAKFTRDGEDCTDLFAAKPGQWSFILDDMDITDSDLITPLAQSQNNVVKVKFNGDRKFIGKTLTVRYTVESSVGELQLSIIG